VLRPKHKLAKTNQKACRFPSINATFPLLGSGSLN
ncbi:hypothetical protein N307_11473, partial [Dryobates pubescens]